MKEIIVALDTPTLQDAHELSAKLKGVVNWVKVGSALFSTSGGAELVKICKAHGHYVMLDLKYHDIPNTVRLACRNAVDLGVDMLTVHLSGGQEMIRAALLGVDEGSSSPFRCMVAGISVLTSLDKKDLRYIGFKHYDMPSLVAKNLIDMGVESNIDAIVCSPMETDRIREEYKDLKIINPGVRMPEEGSQDQKRVSTPKQAFNDGADFIVMGRAVYESEDPVAYLSKVTEHIK